MEFFMVNKIFRQSPLTEATYYILVSLTEPLHGYGIIKKVEEMSNGRVKLAAGTLYGAINSLVSNKLIKPMGEVGESKKRKLYVRTALGSELIIYEIARLEEMSANGRKETEG
jgi:DNA-binding PadR family transcriptional regulator